ncbi:MAG: PqqD family protein [Vulcanimicrobiaceae bacterium]
MKPTKSGNLEVRKVGDEVLVHDPAHGKVHVLNATAGTILEQCDGSRTADEIARSIAEATGADIAIVSNDVAGILKEFTGLQLLVS